MSKVSDRRKRQLVLVALGTLLLVSVVGATLVVGAERTVRNPTFVTDNLEESGVYESMAADMASQFQTNDTTEMKISLDGNGTEPPINRIARESVTPDYVQEQVERNVETTYAYLDGDREDLPLAFDLVPVKERFSAGMAAWVADLKPGQLSPRMGELAANETSYRETRESLTQEQLERIQNRTNEDYSREELLRIYDDYRDDARGELMDRLERRVDESGLEEPVRSAAMDYGSVGVDALVSKDRRYAGFLASEATARSDLSTAVGNLTRHRLDQEAPDRMDLTSGPNGTAATNDTNATIPAGMATLRTGTTLSGVGLVALPFVALAAAGGVGYLSRRRSTALWRVGGIVALGGALGVVVGGLASRVLPVLLNVDADSSSAVGSAVLGMGTRIVWTIIVQSAVVLAVGLVLVAVGLAIRRDVLPVPDAPARAGGAPEAGSADEE